MCEIGGNLRYDRRVMMNNFSSTPEFPKFPIEKFEAELEQEPC